MKLTTKMPVQWHILWWIMYAALISMGITVYWIVKTSKYTIPKGDNSEIVIYSCEGCVYGENKVLSNQINDLINKSAQECKDGNIWNQYNHDDCLAKQLDENYHYYVLKLCPLCGPPGVPGPTSQFSR